MYKPLMWAILSCTAALAGAAHSQEPEQASAQPRQASGNPPPARPGDQEKKSDLSELEEGIRRMQARDRARGSRATPPPNMPKVIQTDRNSFHPPTTHGNADPTVPTDTPARHE